MKTLTKKLWVSILTLAVIFCTVLGFAFSAPNAVNADDSTTTETVDFSTLPSKNLVEGDNLFGKYLYIKPHADEGFGNIITDVGLIQNDGGVAYIFPDEIHYDETSATDHELTFIDLSDVFPVYEYNGGVVIYFNKAVTITQTCPECDYTSDDYILDEHTLIVGEVDAEEAKLLLPLNDYENKALEVGDDLSYRFVKVDCDGGESGAWWSISVDGGLNIYYDGGSDIFSVFDGDGNGNDFEYFGIPVYEIITFDEETGGEYVFERVVEFPDFLSIDIENENGETVTLTTNFVVIGFDADGDFYTPELLSTKNVSPEEGSSSEDGTNTEDGAGSEEEKPDAEKWIVTVWEDVKTFCTEYPVAVVCGAVCLLSIVICIIVSAKKRK